MLRVRHASNLHVLVCVGVCVGFGAAAAGAADGVLDSSFWNAGRYTASSAPGEIIITSVLEAPDGVLVWAGWRHVSWNQSVARWRRVADAVESECVLVLPAGVTAAYFEPAAFDDSGLLVLGGVAELTGGSHRLLFARYHYPACVLDDTFGTDGVLLLDVGAEPAALGAAAQESAGLRGPGLDGTGFDASGAQGVGLSNVYLSALATDGDAIVFAGTYVAEGESDYDGLVGRLLADGELDSGFSSDGLLAVDGRAGFDHLRSIALVPGGRIYVGGNGTLPDGSNSDFYLLALNSNGSPVSNFGIDGLVWIDFEGAGADSPDQENGGIALLSDGRVVLAGSARTGPGAATSAALAMIRPDGSLDPGFGTGGRLVDGARAGHQGIVAQGNGRFVLAAIGPYPSPSYFVSRRLASGAPDPTFAGGASVPIVFFGDGNHLPQRIALQAGNVVVAGAVERDGNPDQGAIARLRNAYLFADGFEIGSLGFWPLAQP